MSNSKFRFYFFYERFFLSLFFIALFFLLTPQCSFAIVANTSLRLDLAQTLESDREYGSTLSLDSGIVDGRVELAVPDITEPVMPYIETFAVQLNPAQGLSLDAGAIEIAGLPARAKNPQFSLASPFYTPTKPNRGKTFGLGTSKKTENAAIEYRRTSGRIACCTSSFTMPTENAWLLVSGEFQSFSDEDTYFTASLFSGTRHIDEKNETTWYIQEPASRETRLFMPAFECLFRKAAIGGNVSGFMNMMNTRAATGCVRSELFLDSAPLLLTGGFCQEGREFLDYDGEQSPVLSRTFIAPRFDFNTNWYGGILSFGALAYSDTIKGDKYYYENSTIWAGGGGVRFATQQTRLLLQGLQKEGTLSLSASIFRRGMFFHWLSGSATGKCLLPAEVSFDRIDSVTVASSVSLDPFARRSSGISACIAYGGEFKPKSGDICNEEELSVEGFFSTRHTEWKCKLSGKIRSDGTPPEGLISLKTGLQ